MVLARDDQGVYHYIRLRVGQAYGYTINIQQQDEVIYDYRLGVGTNTIDILQIN